MSLQLETVIGFSGTVQGGLIAHPSKPLVLYPLGSTIVIKNLEANTQIFLQGHSDTVSCVALSHDGKLCASGQKTHMGFVAPVIVWDLEASLARGEGVQKFTLELHKVKVEALDFSHNDRFLASAGGEDDGKVVIWDMTKGRAVTSVQSPSLTIRFANNRDDVFVTGGRQSLVRWHLDASGKRLEPTDVNLGKLVRTFRSIAIDARDKYAYVGTDTGDLLQIELLLDSTNHCNSIPKFNKASQHRYTMGIRAVQLRGSTVVVGCGDGCLVMLDSRSLKQKHAKTKLVGRVTSLSPCNVKTNHFYAGTSESNIYYVNADAMESQLISTCHYAGVNDVCFPHGCSEIFVTCSKNDIRVWNLRKVVELLRIQVLNLTCNCVTVSPSGAEIISGWSDGKVRAFYPESGELIYVITDAHEGGVTSIAHCNRSNRVVTGGQDGRVRVWKLGKGWQPMESSTREHKSAVNCIKIKEGDDECVSASSDGSCIVWSLSKDQQGTCRLVRAGALFASTMFAAVVYHPDESQLLTTGSDRKLTYWDAYDTNAIRIMDGSLEAEINTLDIEPKNGEVFVSGGNDKMVKLWGYDDGINTYTGKGHSAGINQVRFTPDLQKIVSVGREGAIFVWTMPTTRDESKDE